MSDLHGFELVQETYVTEIESTARLLRHRKTGAGLLSIENSDDHKAFGITFRTPPPDSSGIAHILEHSVLCGSRKYPLKEPFVELLKGSLKTFLNALTYPDKTSYPLASQNTQDFYNLIDVYLDAVFYPRITPEIFQQEGWHYEIEAPDKPIIYKGVVLNEMKGAYSSPERLLGEYSRRSLFPDTAYGLSSGGDPRSIPDLTYEQFKQFHQTYYHPSNAYIFFYGDDDPEERLRLLNAYLNDFERLDLAAQVALQPAFGQPRTVEHTYAVDPGGPPGSRKSMLTVNWLIGAIEDQTLNLALHILGYILVGMLASPLRKALVESGLGEDIVGGGMAGGLRQNYFTTGLKGIAIEKANEIETLILDTLQQLATDGIESETIEAAINTFEFHLREHNTGSFPRGLSIMFRSLSTWLYDGDPLAPIAFEQPLAAIKEHIASDQRFFESLIETYFLQNSHRTTLTLQPDPELSQRESEEERQRLEQVRAAMSAEDVTAAIENTRRLQELQETPDPPEAIATLPRLKLEDLDRHNKPIPLTELPQQDTTVLYHDLPTNGIVYLDVGFNLYSLPQELLHYVVLFGRALREMGTETETYTQLSQRIGRKTGGVRAQPVAMLTNEGESMARLFIRTKATSERGGDMLAILHDMLHTLRLDNRERFRQIVLEARAREEAAIVPGGSGFVNLRLRSCFNEADWANEQMGGISYLFFLRQLVDQVENDWPAVLEKLEQIRALLINRSTMVFNVTVDERNWQQFSPQLDEFIATLPAAPPRLHTWAPTYRHGFEGLTAPARINYVGKAVNMFEHGYQLHGSIGVITRYLRTTWLWEQVRIKGGAYGCFCRFGRHSGIFALVSYRDPNLLNTLDVYDKISHFLRTTPLDETEVTRSIIGRIADLDAYQFPDTRGYASLLRYLTGHTDEIRQRKREEILSTTAGHFRDFADMLDTVRDQGTVVVLGSAEAIAAANEERGTFLTPVQVL